MNIAFIKSKLIFSVIFEQLGKILNYNLSSQLDEKTHEIMN